MRANGGEGRSFAEPSQSVADILPRGFDERDTSRLPALFLNLIEAPKLHSDAAQGFLARQAGL